MNILKIDSSARLGSSRSRELTSLLAQQLADVHPDSSVINRDLTKGLQFITDEMIANYYVPLDKLTEQQKATLHQSDELVDELIASDIIIIGAPMYNFTVTGILKTYIDQICRLGRTFATNENGFEGLLKNKTAYLIITTGGTPIGGDSDFLSSYLRHVLAFLGITDVKTIVIDQLNPEQAQQAFQQAKQTIAGITA